MNIFFVIGQELTVERNYKKMHWKSNQWSNAMNDRDSESSVANKKNGENL